MKYTFLTDKLTPIEGQSGRFVMGSITLDIEGFGAYDTDFQYAWDVAQRSTTEKIIAGWKEERPALDEYDQ